MMSEAAGNPWRDTPEATRTLVRDMVQGLLHDWIKYMEMRLLSIDWTDPPAEAATLFWRAVVETRKAGGTVRGVPEIWNEAKQALAACGEAATAQLVDGLDGDVQVLCAMAEWSREELGRARAQVEAAVRRPGERLRAVLAEMGG